MALARGPARGWGNSYRCTEW